MRQSTTFYAIRVAALNVHSLAENENDVVFGFNSWKNLELISDLFQVGRSGFEEEVRLRYMAELLIKSLLGFAFNQVGRYTLEQAKHKVDVLNGVDLFGTWFFWDKHSERFGIRQGITKFRFEFVPCKTSSNIKHWVEEIPY